MSTITLHRPNFSRRWRCGSGGGGGAPSCWRIVNSGRKIQNSTSSKFGHFVARECRHHEEYWTAAWLRAESRWENPENERYAACNHIREFAQQEFNAMSRRYNANLGDKCKCIVTVQEEYRAAPTTAKSVVGTLDLSIQHFKYGETFPGECLKHPFLSFISRKDSICYAYIANLCVAKSARRQGVGRCMLEYAISIAKANGAEKAFVHVHRHNTPARNLYQKVGFQVVDAANIKLSVGQTYLLCLDVSRY